MSEFQDLPPETPVCKNCAHLVGNRSYPENSHDWKCGEWFTGKDLVSGIRQYESCYTARSSMLEIACGLEGRKFSLYQQPQAPAGKPARSSPSADSLLGELGL